MSLQPDPAAARRAADLPTLCMSGYLRPESASQEVQLLEQPSSGQKRRGRVRQLLATAAGDR